MKSIEMLVTILLFVCQITAQELIKKDLLSFFDKIPSPPITTQEAFSKITIVNAEAMQLNTDRVYGALENELNEMASALSQQMQSASMAAVPPGAPAGMQDPEMKKKMKQMSPEEKKKFAMEMMKSMPAGLMAQQPESATIQSALSEAQKINSILSTEYQQSVEWQQEELRIKQENEKAHQDIDHWQTAEIAKLPQINYGEMSAPDPTLMKTVKRKANDQHIAQAEQNLKQIGVLWKNIADHKKTLYTPFCQKLTEADYGAGYKNFTTFKFLSDTQMMIIKDLAALTEMSRIACEESAKWLVIRQNIEKE